MSFLGKFTPNVFSASNENTLAFVAPRTEFSLIKVEAPVEFGPVGSALSRLRKRDAEEGVPHRTARRLGTLFEQIIPQTPKLISSYGRRVSEIMMLPGVNPEGLASDGPFRDCVGADATAMWAAATSGTAAIAMYMLACFIAHAFDEKEAISLWVELVDERKNQICTQKSQNFVISDASMYGAQQEISRRDLALWDNSARSWLRSADENKLDEKVRLRLIVENLEIPHYSAITTYEKVIGSWTEAMNGIEKLLDGKPQEAQNKSVALGLQSWHLYPDLIVLSNKTQHILFRDPLFPTCATLTLGILTRRNESPTGSKWSLALSHYQYYGNAVSVQSQEDSSKITMQQALIVALGALMGIWGLQDSRDSEMYKAAHWFRSLFYGITRDTLSVEKWTTNPPRGLGCLGPFFEAAEVILLTSAEKEKKLTHQLFQLGQRRYKSFLTRSSTEIPPFFGLCNRDIALSLTQESSEECNVEYLRNLASHLNCLSRYCIIFYRRSDCEMEIITALPAQFKSRKRESDREPKTSFGHIRWVYSSGPKLMTYSNSFLSINSSPFNLQQLSKPDDSTLRKRCKDIEELGEQARLECDGHVDIDGNDHSTYQLKWTAPPDEFLSDNMKSQRGRKSGQGISMTFKLLEGNKDICLLIASPNENHFHQQVTEMRYITDFDQTTINIEDSGKLTRTLNSQSLELYLTQISMGHTMQATTDAHLSYESISKLTNSDRRLLEIAQRSNKLMFGWQFKISGSGLSSLVSLALSRKIYKGLGSAFVSTKVFNAEYPIGRCRWFGSNVGSLANPPSLSLSDDLLRFGKNIRTISHSCAIACVLYMDSGVLDLDGKDLKTAFAVSRENSIYVASRILSDPRDKDSTSRGILTRLVGNIGRSGTSVLVTPHKPLINESVTDFRVIYHNTYDNSQENNFEGSSLHMQLTEWSPSIVVEDKSHTIDRTAQYQETVIRLRDKGKWIADLDIRPILRGSRTVWQKTLELDCDCHKNTEPMEPRQVISLDSWEELLDPPMKAICIFRAHGNWSARLAAACILTQKGLAEHTAIAGPGSFCLNCLQRRIRVISDDKTTYIID